MESAVAEKKETRLEDRLGYIGTRTDFEGKGYMQIAANNGYSQGNWIRESWAKIGRSSQGMSLAVAHIDIHGTEREAKFSFMINGVNGSGIAYTAPCGVLEIRNFNDEIDTPYQKRDYTYSLAGRDKFRNTVRDILATDDAVKLLTQKFSESQHFKQHAEEIPKLFGQYRN